ncbi:hypothetical protein KP509_23G068600 [Ceratopteris richardii]|uniref:Cyclic nucleotide-binding domain-containing protein n=1 Tax=Ceratopteris richardii TaxID=49495 RepID=A0A8T2S0T4_CERRI|nr:hypothetical protein KP509_23G068600 [Ceratopteris richardii]
MGQRNKKTVRFNDDFQRDHGRPAFYMQQYNTLSSERAYSLSDSVKRGSRGLKKLGKALRTGVSKAFQEDHEVSNKTVLDPNSNFVQQWNKIFLVSCVVALFLDPLFFFLPALGDHCIRLQRPLMVAVTVLRTIVDVFYLFHMALQFRTAYVEPYSRVFGLGVLVSDSKLIAKRYLLRDFWLDLLAVLPIPQVVIWIIVPNSAGPRIYQTKNALRFIVFLQYIPRLYLIFPLMSQIVKSTGLVAETAWAGAAYNLVLYMLASHFIGACWYLLAIERIDTCWRHQCRAERNECKYDYLYCGATNNNAARDTWLNSTNVFNNCVYNSPVFDFGIYEDAFSKGIVIANFVRKYLFCLWYGLLQLSSLGQNLQTSTFPGEIFFAIFIAIFGLVLFALLIGNMQTYLQSVGVRLEEWRVKQSDTEEWMHHRQLPPELRERVRRYNQYKWVATRGVDEEGLIQSLPPDLRRDIKRHLCLDLVKQVGLFREMDERLLDAICERLKPVLCIKDTVIMREGDPVCEMFFIIRGTLDSQTTNGGRTGFFNQLKLEPGHFCGEELLTWVLSHKPGAQLPTSTRTVLAVGEVEAFALTAEDLQFVANQFRRLHSKKIQQTLRFYSPSWQTWAAGFIQAAWKRYKRRKHLAELYSNEQTSLLNRMENMNEESNIGFGTTILASRFAKNAMRGVHKLRESETDTSMDEGFLKVPKPEEPDFGLDAEAHDQT